MGLIDRILRIAFAVVILILYLTGSLYGTAAVVLGVIAVVFLLTGLLGFCPLYVPLKISTRKK